MCRVRRALTPLVTLAAVLAEAPAGVASNHAFRWTAKTGMQEMQSLLSRAGVTTVQGLGLRTASRVSADGTVIVGSGLDPNKQWEPFGAVLPLP